MLLNNSSLRRVLDWTDRLSVWNDATLDEFLQEIYGFNMAQGYIDEKREKLKRSIMDWFCDLDATNQTRLTNLINTQSPSQWWLNHKENE